ncbi:hypothetical protein GCM10009801_26480 [Streptomyces albiaxialis]|uniref:Uncharacterized protein n=1 Tax=Streptomyces albiaxialis TaxID=329523 RepID=A0ABN2VUU6_9ACTN
MSASGVWAVGALPGPDVARLAPVAAPAIRAAAARPSARAAWRRWERDAARGGGAVPVLRPDGYSSDEALRLLDLVNDSPVEALDEAGELDVMTWWGRLEGPVEPFAAAARKDNPVAALFHALGPARAAALPGWAGDAVLTPAELRAALPRTEAALAFTAPERATALARAAEWPETDDPAGLLDGPLRVVREAAASGHGLFAARLWI